MEILCVLFFALGVLIILKAGWELFWLGTAIFLIGLGVVGLITTTRRRRGRHRKREPRADVSPRRRPSRGGIMGFLMLIPALVGVVGAIVFWPILNWTGWAGAFLLALVGFGAAFISLQARSTMRPVWMILGSIFLIGTFTIGGGAVYRWSTSPELFRLRAWKQLEKEGAAGIPTAKTWDSTVGTVQGALETGAGKAITGAVKSAGELADAGFRALHEKIAETGILESVGIGGGTSKAETPRGEAPAEKPAQPQKPTEPEKVYFPPDLPGQDRREIERMVTSLRLGQNQAAIYRGEETRNRAAELHWTAVEKFLEWLPFFLVGLGIAVSLFLGGREGRRAGGWEGEPAWGGRR